MSTFMSTFTVCQGPTQATHAIEETQDQLTYWEPSSAGSFEGTYSSPVPRGYRDKRSVVGSERSKGEK